MKIKVKNSGVVKLQHFDDAPDGNLIVGASKKEIPFVIKRFYYITNLTNPRAIRGMHAHKKTRQCIFCVSGKFTLDLDDGHRKQSLTLKDAHHGILLGNMLWHSMRNFSKNCLLLVISSDYYKKQDYIRDYDQFLKLAKKK